jgi:hypothetical protein
VLAGGWKDGCGVGGRVLANGRKDGVEAGGKRACPQKGNLINSAIHSVLFLNLIGLQVVVS